MGAPAAIYPRARTLLLAFSVLALAAVILPAMSSALTNPERSYEMVSPPYKGGYGVKEINAVAPDGNTVLFRSPGTFAGEPSGVNASIATKFQYIARRSPTGWTTSSVAVPSATMPFVEELDVSPSLGTIVAYGRQGNSYEDALQDPTEVELWLHSTETPDTPENWELTGRIPRNLVISGELSTLTYEDAGSDFCHVILRDNWGPALVQGLPGGRDVIQLYDDSRGCNGEPAGIKAIGVDNQGGMWQPTCEVGLGNLEFHIGVYPEGQEHDQFNAVADDGREIFFTQSTHVDELGECVNDGRTNFQLFVRVGGERTLEVSKPLGEACSEVPCPGAQSRAPALFMGASEDGSVVYFMTQAPLDSGTDKDSAADLYMARIGCPADEPGCAASARTVTSLVQVSAAPNGEPADVQGVVRVAPNGERVYFVASGDLLDSAERTMLAGEGHALPRPGADNLYVYDNASGEVKFIGDLCSGKTLSGTVEAPRCPASESDERLLWRAGGEPRAQTAGADGRFLVFSTFAQLTAGDTDAAQDVYRYDAATGVLQRVSIGENGFDANGNSSEFAASIPISVIGKQWFKVLEQHELGTRTVSEDGSRIIFTTSEPLSPDATNGLENLYEWHENPGGGEGSVSLISSGTSGQPVTPLEVVISQDGGDVFFVTSQSLVAQDTDTVPDVYDARIGGGSFSVTAAEPRPCEGDACQGPLTNPAPLLVPGSAVQTPIESPPSPLPGRVNVKPKTKTKKCPVGRKQNRSKCAKAKSKNPKKSKKSDHKGSK